MKNFFKEFAAFVAKGNVLNLAVGVIIGAAFQNVVSSLTDNILSPIIGLFIGQNFDSLKIQILEVTISYGAFITSLINFIIMAFVVFMLVKAMSKVTAAYATKPEAELTCPYCMSPINKNATRCPACTSVLKNIERK